MCSMPICPCPSMWLISHVPWYPGPLCIYHEYALNHNHRRIQPANNNGYYLMLFHLTVQCHSHCPRLPGSWTVNHPSSISHIYLKFSFMHNFFFFSRFRCVFVTILLLINYLINWKPLKWRNFIKKKKNWQISHLALGACS